MNEKLLNMAESAFSVKYPEFYNILERHSNNSIAVNVIDSIAPRRALAHFLNGYLAGHKQAEIEASTVPYGWIDVKTRLPDLIEGKQHSEKVMCIYTAENYSGEKESFIGTFALLATDDYTEWIKVSNDLAPVKQRDIANGYTEDVTHWMPLTLP